MNMTTKAVLTGAAFFIAGCTVKVNSGPVERNLPPPTPVPAPAPPPEVPVYAPTVVTYAQVRPDGLSYAEVKKRDFCASTREARKKAVAEWDARDAWEKAHCKPGGIAKPVGGQDRVEVFVDGDGEVRVEAAPRASDVVVAPVCPEGGPPRGKLDYTTCREWDQRAVQTEPVPFRPVSLPSNPPALK